MNFKECFKQFALLEEDSSKLYAKFSENYDDKIKLIVLGFSKEEEKHKNLKFDSERL